MAEPVFSKIMRQQLASVAGNRFSSRAEVCTESKPRLRVFMMDLLSVVAYYDAYLCQALQSQDIDVALGAITYYLDRGCFRRQGVRNHPGLLDFVGKRRLPATLRRTLKVLEMVINLVALAVRFVWARPDVVHVQYLPLLERRFSLELWFLRYCRSLGSAVISTVHDILPHDTGEWHELRFKRTYEMMDGLICHSEAVKQELVTRFGIPSEQVWVIPHGPLFHDRSAPAATRSEQLESASSPTVVLCQGWVRPYKGIEFLLDSWKEVQQTGAKAKLLIAGSGDFTYLDRIRERVDLLALQDSVELCFGFVSVGEMLAQYQAADILVYPYKAITTSGALMTGLAQRKAIVATSLPAFREILQHGKNAFLCDYGDVKSFASALVSLINDPALRRRLANKTAPFSIGGNSWQEIAAQTKDCYASVLCSRALGNSPAKRLRKNKLAVSRSQDSRAA